MIDFSPDSFFEIGDFAHAGIFPGGDPVWACLGKRLVEYLEAWQDWSIHSKLPDGVHLMGDRIFIAPGCTIEPGALIIGPAILDQGVEIRTGAYVRQNVVLGAGSLVGQQPHQVERAAVQAEFLRDAFRIQSPALAITRIP